MAEDTEPGLDFFEDDESEIELLLDSVKDPIDRLYKLSTWIRNASSGPGPLKAQSDKQIAQEATIGVVTLAPAADGQGERPTSGDTNEDNKPVADFKHGHSAGNSGTPWADSPREDLRDLKSLGSLKGENVPEEAIKLDPQRFVRWQVVKDIRSDQSNPREVMVRPATTTIRDLKDLRDLKDSKGSNMGRGSIAAPKSHLINLETKWTLSSGNSDPIDNMMKRVHELETRQELGEAENVYRQGLRTIQMDRGRDHPSSIKVLSRLGCLLMMREEPAAAVKVFREGLDISSKHHIMVSQEKIQIMNNLANALIMADMWPEAEELYSEGLALSKGYLGEGHENTLTLMSNYGSILHEQGDFTEAQEILEPCAMLSSRHLGMEHPLYKEASRLLSRARKREY